MYTEDELLPISALQHLRFCPRQCALIHVERAWADNRLTVEGQQTHRRAHGGQADTRNGTEVARAVPLRSLRLGLFGVADVVEFHLPAAPAAQRLPVPIEYKRGRPKRMDGDRVQLCAQALCLEEMLDVHVPRGFLYYAAPHRRDEIRLDPALRRTTEQAAVELHALLHSGRLPSASKQPKCRRCSLRDVCLPDAISRRTGVAGYIRHQLAAAIEATGLADSGDAG